MTTGKPTREQLHDVLRTLAPDARARLVTELERGLLRGDEVPGCQIVLKELRRSFGRADEPLPRVGNPSRLFFRTFEPFLVNAPDAHNQSNCIARASLTPLWTWICEKLAPAQARAFCRSASEALLAGHADKAARLTRDFQDHVRKRMQETLAAARADADIGARIAREMATARGLPDLQTAIDILKARDALAALRALAEIEIVMDRIKADPNDPSLARLIKGIPDAARGLPPSLDVPADSPWRRQLVAIRGELSGRLKREIELLPERVRHLLAPRAGDKAAARPALDEKQAAEIERLIELARACGAYAAQLHIQEAIWNTVSELQEEVREAKQALLAWLRAAGAAGRDLRRSRLAAAVRISAKVFDDDYAAQFAAEVGLSTDRMAAGRTEFVRTA
jgi:hypothetical protein